jgi:hypothetical protein
MAAAPSGHGLSARPVFHRNISADSAFNYDLSKKEHFHEARESLLGVWQTDNRSEHVVLMVRTAEEIVLGSPRGGIERGIACYDRVSCPTWAHVFRGVINGNPRLASVFEH